MCHAVYQYAKDFGSVYCNCRQNIKFEELRRYFSDDSKDLERIPNQTYEFHGETEKMVELDPSKSIIVLTDQDKKEADRKKILERQMEDRYCAEEMLKKYRFNMNKNI